MQLGASLTCNHGYLEIPSVDRCGVELGDGPLAVRLCCKVPQPHIHTTQRKRIFADLMMCGGVCLLLSTPYTSFASL
jgi:hypothetical protein